jgi:peroxiredoxin
VKRNKDMRRRAITCKTVLYSLLLALFGTIVLPACQTDANSAKAPDFTLLNLQNETVSLSDFRGKVVILNFWATYCPPCRVEIPDFIRLQDQYGKDGLVVLGISTDPNGDQILPRYVQAMEINYPILLATSKVIEDYGNIYALPVTFVVDRDHKILKQYTGMVTQDELTPIVQKALGLPH